MSGRGGGSNVMAVLRIITYNVRGGSGEPLVERMTGSMAGTRGKSCNMEYTHVTWNPVTGCNHVSPGCDHCYAERMALRLRDMGVEKYRNGFAVTLHPDVLEQPTTWRRPRAIFINSMSDLFHETVPIEYVRRILDVVERCPQHVFQVLTKRSKKLVRAIDQLSWPCNLWVGVTVESAVYKHRIDDLRKVPSAVRWLSIEPLLGPLGELDLAGIGLAVVGGESGPGARPMREEWVQDILKQCRTQGTSFYFKQWGGVDKRATGRRLRGKLYEEWPQSESEPGQLTLEGL